jgi:hypothetical protein
MNPEQAKELRAPFANVQHVTKTWTDKNTGQRKSVTLDYISHAVVTNRLLTVDPSFSFEPLLDATGFPIVVDKGLAGGDEVGVWGRLTILEAATVEFCSGKDLMDAYSRCLCRAAMRRGVALDLWIKDDEFKVSGAGQPQTGQKSGGSAVSDTEAGSNPAPDNPVVKAQAAAEAAKAARTPQDDGAPENVVLTFGKYKGSHLGAAPKAYLTWLTENFEAKNAEHRRIVTAANLLLNDPDEDVPF